MWLFHRHEWQPAASEVVWTYTMECGQKIYTGVHTEILWRCGCGGVRTKRVNGKWSSSDLFGPLRRQPS